MSPSRLWSSPTKVSTGVYERRKSVPVHIEEMTTEVSVAAGELPLTSAQIDKLVAVVISKLAEKKREAAKIRDATKLRRQASAPFEAGS